MPTRPAPFLSVSTTDAAAHFLGDGDGTQALSLVAPFGELRIIGLCASTSIGVEHLERLGVVAGGRLLLNTAHSRTQWWPDPYRDEYVAVSREGDAFLSERRVACVGIDHLSIAPPDDARAVHRLLLASHVAVVEGLDLSRVQEGTYELICLPLHIPRSDGAPARAIAKPLLRSDHG